MNLLKSRTYNLEPNSRGFTLLEILVVVSIIALIYVTALIGYDALRERARKNSAMAVATTVMKELLVCADSGGYAITGSAPTSLPSASATFICCSADVCVGNTAQAGHTAKWPDLGSSRWNYGDGSNGASAPVGSLTNPPTYIYYLANFDGTKTITCAVADKKCQ